MKKNTVNATPATQNIITLENLETNAKKASYVSLRTMHKNSGENKFYLMMQAIISNDTSNGDAMDVLQVAYLSLLENMDDIENNFKLACKAIHKYIYSLNAVHGKYKTLYINDYENSNGDIVNVNNEISHLINGLVMQDQITNITTLLSKTQNTILKYIAYGYTNIQIAKKLNCTKQNISNNISKIKAKIESLYPELVITITNNDGTKTHDYKQPEQPQKNDTSKMDYAKSKNVTFDYSSKITNNEDIRQPLFTPIKK